MLLYLHGGLNDEAAVAQRIVAFRDVFLENEIYPVHIMWESGVVRHPTSSSRTSSPTWTSGRGRRRTGSAARDGLVEAKDRSLELTAAGPVRRSGAR